MDSTTMTAIANLVTQTAGTVGAAATQQTAGAVRNQAATYQAAGVTYRAETAATIDEYRAGLVTSAAVTNRNFALARADRMDHALERQLAGGRDHGRAGHKGTMFLN